METVLVLPIYMMLLGGLFIVGDVMLGRLVLQASGRYEAWATHAKCEMEKTVSVFKYAEVEPYFHLENDGADESPPYSTGFRFTDGQRANGNMWAYARIGMTRAIVELPLWTAMFDVPRGAPSTGQDKTESKNRLHADGSTFCWGFDYHRISESDIAELGGNPDLYRRSNPCTSPEGSSLTLQEMVIVYDSHFGDKVSGEEPHDGRQPYKRNPILGALGM